MPSKAVWSEPEAVRMVGDPDLIYEVLLPSGDIVEVPKAVWNRQPRESKRVIVREPLDAA